MRNVLAVAFACATTLISASAQPFEFHTVLNGATAGSGSPATGSDLNPIDAGFPPITLDTAANTLRLPIGWGSGNEGIDLQSDYQQESWLYRIVSGTPQELYNVQTYPGVYVDQVSSGKSGSYDKTVTLTDIAGYTVDQQEQDIQNGLWFLRVDSMGFPNGEIAGQLTPVPEPEHYAMLAGLGLIGFAVYRRVRRTQTV